MFKSERQNEILKVLAQEGYATVERLSKLLYASESSIRRDLNDLKKNGLVIRSYGGVQLVRSNARDIAFSSRLHQRVPEKQRIVQKALELINEKDIVFLDLSSSALYLAQELMGKKRITIVTNNLEILCMDQPKGVTIYSSSGRASSYRRCLIGEQANAIFEQIRADLVFFSPRALSPDGIVYGNTMEEVMVTNAMLKNAAKKVLLCDSQKFDTYAGYRQCALSDVDYMISEVDCREKYQKFAPNTTFLTAPEILY